MTNENTVEILNDLLAKAYDAEQGYAHAAERADSSPALAQFFRTQSTLRNVIGHELKGQILNYGGQPDKGASIVAKAHQIWITLRDLAQGGSEEAILTECERGEEASLKEYDDALAAAGLPNNVRRILHDQRSRIAAALKIIRVEEDLAE